MVTVKLDTVKKTKDDRRKENKHKRRQNIIVTSSRIRDVPLVASTCILPPTLVHAFVFVSKPTYSPVLVHTSTPVPESTDTVIDVILRLNLASTENILPFCLQHCRVVALPVGLHNGVVSVTTGTFVGVVVGKDEGLDDGLRVVGFAVLGFEDEGLDDGLLDVTGRTILSTDTDGLDDGVRVVGSDVDGLKVVGDPVGLEVGAFVDGLEDVGD